MEEELYIISEEHGKGKVVSINEEENTAKVEYEDGFEEDLDLDDEFNFDFDDEEETDVTDAEETPETEEDDVVEEGRGKKGVARQASKHASDDDDDSYERKGDKPAKGRFIMDRARKHAFQESADLLGLALDKKPTEFSAEFANVLQAKITDRLADLKLDIAKNLHKDSDVENS